MAYERYQPNEWVVGDPITQEKMNHIEKGIDDVHSLANDNQTNISAINSSMTNLTSEVAGAKDKADLAQTTANTAESQSQQGMTALAALDYFIKDPETNEYLTDRLKERIIQDESNIATASTNASNLLIEIIAARGNKIHQGNNATANNLAEKLTDMDLQISANKGAISSMDTDYKNARGGYNSLMDRIVAIDGDGANAKTYQDKSLASHVTDLETEIEAAHHSAVNSGGDYNSLDARLEADESIIKEITNAHRDGITGGDTLDKRLDDIDNVGSASNQTHAYRISQLETEMSNARQDSVNLDARLDSIDTNINTINTNLGYSDLSSTETIQKKINDAKSDLETRIDAIDNGSTGSVAGLDARISANESAIGTLNGNASTSGSVLNTVNTRIAEVINSAPEAFDTLKEIADWIGENSDDALTMQTNIGANADAITALQGRATNIENNATSLGGRITTLESDLNTTTTGLKDRVATAEDDIDALEADLNTANTGLKARVTALENEPKSATAIIAADCITYNNETGIPTIYTDNTKTTAITPTEEADYLLENADGKYYYWKYIGTAPNGTWNLISGGGGSGTGSSSGEFVASLAAISEPNENIDYFVGNGTDGYIHYRYIPAEDPQENGAFVQILPKNLVNSLGVASINVTTADASGEAPAVVSQMSGGILAYNTGDTGHTTNLLSNFTALRYARLKSTYEEDGITLKKQELIFTDTTGTDMAPIEIKGGGGGSTDYSVRLINMSDATTFMAPASDDAVTTISLKPIVNYGNTIAEGVTISATVQYKLSTETDDAYENAAITIPTITNNTAFNLNVSSLLGEANTTTDIKVTVSTQPDGDQGETYTKSLTYHITTVVMELESIGFDQAAIRSGNQFTFSYKCKGYGLSKVMTFIVDNGTPITQDIGTSHNETLSKIISLQGLSNGMHTLRAYYSVGTATSNELNYYFIYNSDAERTAPIVAVAGASSRIHYGDDLIINYTVYTPGQERTDAVEIEVFRKDGNTEIPISSFSQANVLNSTVIPFTIPEYPLNESQYTIYVRITGRKNGTPALTDTQTAEIIILPAAFDYQLKYADPDNHNLVFMYNVAGKSNNDVNKETYSYPYTPQDGNDPFNFTASFNNFNWATNGYIADKTTGENALVISGGANCAINVPIFSRTYSYTPSGASSPISVNIEADSSKTSINQNGRTIEIDYEVVSTVDANSTIIECMGANGAGIKVTPQSCYLVSSTTPANVAQDSSGFINNESSIAAAYLSTGQRIHLVFVIEPEAETESAVGGYHQCVNIFVNGEFANSQPYSKGTVFSSDATMTIGNASSLIKLYGIRMYNRGFSDKEVLQNYMMAPSKINDKLVRFEANNVLDNENGLVDYYKARTKYNCLLLTGTMSPYKGSPSTIRFDGVDNQGNPVPVKKRESGLTLTKPNAQASSHFVTEFSLLDKLNDGGYASSNNVQGTSSQKYPIHNLKVYLAKGREGTEVFDTETNISVKEVYKYSIKTAATAAYKSVYTSATDSDIPSYITNCASTIATTVKNLSAVPTQAEVVEMIEAYLTEQDAAVGAAYSTYSAGNELIVHPIVAYTKSDKVKYKLNGSNSIGESTLCWKADYMSTDHANTYNANLANGLFSAKLPSQDPEQGGDSKVQNTVKGIRCLLFLQSDENATPVFIGDGCLNNDKGNNKSFGLEHSQDDGNNTLRQKWEFTNNSEGLCLFKSDHLYEMVTTGEGANQTTKMRAKNGFESTFPDEGDLADEGLEPNYTHLQILLTWVYQRANFWDASTINNGTTYSYNGQTYNTEYDYRKAIFLNEFSRHFVLNHVLTYYVFSEFIALCDNRAKNMFLRCDNVRSEVIKLASDPTQIIINGNAFGNDDDTLWNTIVNHTTGVVNADAIDWENSTFAVWAPVLYDLDSCYGVENVGYLTIPYDADWYYNLKGLAKSQLNKTLIDNPVINGNEQISFQFSGVASRLWLMVEEAYGANIKALAKTLYSRDDGLNYYNVYTSQIEDNLIETSPALVNQDMILKFQNPWETGFIDYSQKPPTQSTEVYKYLQRGTKTSQKDSFVYRRSTLLASKYQADSFIKGSINFRTNISIPETQLDRTGITVTANQMIYPAVTYGDNKDPISSATKIAANTPCTFYATSEVGATDTIHIAGGAVLTDVGDLSKWSPYEVKVGLGANLKTLILGNKAAGYENLKLDRLDLTNCQLLEVINVENCKALEELDVSGNGLIKEIYTFASNVKRVTVPNGGVLTKLELGSQVTAINIQNQSYLTTFSYEGDDDVNITNPYSAVNTLWIENTPNVPIVDIIVKNAANLTGGIRLNNINVSLGNDPTFLQILASEQLMRGKYINSSGELDATQYPYITGTVTVYDLRRSLYNTLHTLYPNLTVTVTHEIIDEFTINYYNDDGTLLFTDHRTGSENYIDPASINALDLNPITGMSYLNNTLPQKEMGAAYIYRFGTYSSDTVFNYTTYQRYSGWINQNTNEHPQAGDQVSGDTNFIAVYPEESAIKRKYTAIWYDDVNGNELLRYTEDYGTDLSTFQQPEERGMTRVITSGNTTKVFKGWSRPAGKLTENINIYAQWETSTINGATSTIDTSTLNAADIYAISRLGTAQKRNLLEQIVTASSNYPIMIPMGQDFDYETGVTTTDLLGTNSKFVFSYNDSTRAKIYDGNHGIGEVRPLATNQDWTLALDYKFLIPKGSIGSSSEFVLASCYQNANSSIQGFKLSLIVPQTDVITNSYKNCYIRVTWGTASADIDWAAFNTTTTSSKQYARTYRNMVVLRHRAAEPTKLYVYYVAPDVTQSYSYNNYGYGAELGQASAATVLTWQSNANINTPLILGGNYSGTTTNIESSTYRYPASGIVYWGKYWNEDLGIKNCNKLAAWTHESIPFYITGYNNNDTPTRQIINNSSLSLVAAQGIGDRYYSTQRSLASIINGSDPEVSTNEYSWRVSLAERLCNNRVYKGLPTSYQSIITKTTINSVVINGTYDHETTQDYLFLPSYREVTTEASPINSIDFEVNTAWISPWPWMQATNVSNVYVYDNTEGVMKLSRSGMSIKPFLYRFCNKYITPTTRIFNTGTSLDPDNGSGWTYNSTTIYVQSGDVWIRDNGIAYIYYTNAEINEGVYVDEISANGGWKQAELWPLRTYNVYAGFGSENQFMFVNSDGTVKTQPVNNDRNYGRILCPEFSI